MTAAATSASRRWVVDFLLLAALWGVSFLFMRLATVEFGPFPTALGRVAIASLVLAPLALARGHGGVLLAYRGRLLAAGLVNSGLPFACFGFAVLHISTGLSSILNATVPLFGALVAWHWFGDRPGWSRGAGLALGFAGVAALTVGRGAPPGPADSSNLMSTLAIGACLLATFSYALAASFARRFLGGLPPVATAAGSLMGATLGLLLPALWAWPASMPSATAWIALLLSGVFSTGLAYLLYFRLIETAGPTRTLTVTYAIPVFAVVFGAIFLGETITGTMVACGAVILCGTALATGLIRLPRT